MYDKDTKLADKVISLTTTQLRVNMRIRQLELCLLTYSSFAPMSPLGSVHLVVVIIIESVFCCVGLQNPLRQKETENKKKTFYSALIKLASCSHNERSRSC